MRPEVLQYDELQYTLKNMISVGDNFKEDGDCIRTSFCASEKYLLGIVADGRGKDVCKSIVNAELDKLALWHMPTFVTDGYKPYLTTLFDRYSQKVYNNGRGRPGCHLEPFPDFNYGVVEKTRKGKKLEKVRRYVAYGDVPEHLLNTSAIERHNLTIRLFDARIRRRTVTFGRYRGGGRPGHSGSVQGLLQSLPAPLVPVPEEEG